MLATCKDLGICEGEDCLHCYADDTSKKKTSERRGFKMNVLEAIDKLESLDQRITALVKAILRMDSDKDFKNEVYILNEIKNEIVVEHDALKDRLSKTPLVNTR